MRIDIATLFPEMCEVVLSTSIIGRARKAGFIEVYCHNIRDFSEDKHQRVDAAPYGGGNGMLMQADPIFKCYEHVCEDACSKPFVIYMSPQGAVLDQKMAVDFSENYEHLFLICGIRIGFAGAVFVSEAGTAGPLYAEETAPRLSSL